MRVIVVWTHLLIVFTYVIMFDFIKIFFLSLLLPPKLPPFIELSFSSSSNFKFKSHFKCYCYQPFIHLDPNPSCLTTLSALTAPLTEPITKPNLKPSNYPHLLPPLVLWSAPPSQFSLTHLPCYL